MARFVGRREEAVFLSPFGFSDLPKGGSLLSKRVIDIVNSATERQLGRLDIYTFSEFLSKVTSTTLITALILVDKFRQLDPKPLLFYEITATELLIVATLAASKFLHDTDTEEGLSNGAWASTFDIDLKALNAMEIRFFSALHWNLFVSKSDFNDFLMNRFAAPVPSGKVVRNRSKRQHPDPIVRGISSTSFRQKRGKSLPRWSLAKAMAMCAAAFLAFSHPGMSNISDDSYMELLLASSSLTSPTSSPEIPDLSSLLADRLMVLSVSGFNYTMPGFHSCRNAPNDSRFSHAPEERLHHNSTNAIHTHLHVQKPNFVPTLLVVGVS
ncbi:unnamed protein product [Hydatigera taeniaeformis]|uniref:Protein CNPPD1 n=1 Tax=Hydatigena taeniaeformis TaxID=6205 RepID=A0A0R3WVR2_HYDTA|nr:unnamed protein product [Hydatigera taeniaeformis]